jgi:tetratricopeptide (TPR) repeat protein
MQLAARVHRAHAAYDALADCVVEGIRRAAGDGESVDTVMAELANADRSMNLFDEYRSTQQWERCLALVDRLLAVMPADSIADNRRRGVLHQVKFECCQPLGRLDDAAKAIEAAIASDPANAVYPNSYGLLLRYLGRTDEAIAQFRASLEIREGHEWSSENLATTLLAAGRWDAFFPHMAAALGWAADRVTGARETHAGLVARGAEAPALAAAQEELEYQLFHAANLRRLYLEGLRLQRAEAAKKP